jgi:hypothetical protein
VYFDRDVIESSDELKGFEPTAAAPWFATKARSVRQPVSDSDLLQTIAEIAIALAGFSGVVAFLGQRARGEWRSVDLFRFNQLLGSSFAALMFSFSPILLFRMGVSEPTAWRWSSGFIAAYLAAAVLLSNRGIRHLPGGQRDEIIPWVLTLILVIMAAVFVLQVLCAAGIAYAGEPGPVLVGLVWLLGFSAFQFIRLLRMLRAGGDAA